MSKFVGTKRQFNGLWMSFFYSHNDELHKVTKDEDYEELAYFELLMAIKEFDEEFPNIETYYKRKIPIIKKKKRNE